MLIKCLGQVCPRSPAPSILKRPLPLFTTCSIQESTCTQIIQKNTLQCMNNLYLLINELHFSRSYMYITRITSLAALSCQVTATSHFTIIRDEKFQTFIWIQTFILSALRRKSDVIFFRCGQIVLLYTVPKSSEESIDPGVSKMWKRPSPKS